MLTPIDRIRCLARAWPVTLALLLVAPIAVAQDEIQVTSADPAIAEQGTVDLEVMVGGANFPADAEVDFFVTGTQDPDGITVKKVKRQRARDRRSTSINAAERTWPTICSA